MIGFKKILFVISLLFISGCVINYDFDYSLQPDYVLKSAGIDKEDYINGLKEELNTNRNNWGIADTYLILARLENNTKYYNKACDYFSLYNSEDPEERAILYETIASLNCYNEKKDYLEKAKKEWAKIGVSWRVKLLDDIINGEQNLIFNTTKISPKLNLSGYNAIIIGETSIEITKDTKFLTQVDRVYRDWLGRQMKQTPFSGEILSVFSERLTYNESELREDIGWHEGGRSRDLQKNLGINPITAVGTIVAQKNGKWYASDEKGIFQFEVPLDKISYPQTRFLTKDIAMIVDTHGVNMLVEQAIRKKVDVVLSDCDHEDKTKASLYLSNNGISVICFPDRFLYYALGHNAKLVGSPTWRFDEINKKMIYGDSPITLIKNQKIVVTNADIGKSYAIWYYTTPWFYFNEINKTFPLTIIPVVVDDFYQTDKVFETARKHNVNVVATRVFNSYDYNQAKKWLSENKNNKIILFHSTMYPYAVILINEFEGRISFDDPNPIGIK